MTRKTLIATATIFSAAAIGFTGCGGGPSHQDFVANMNKMCRDGNAQIDKLNKEFKSDDPDRKAAELSAGLDIDNKEFLPILNKMDVPDEDSTAFASYKTANEKLHALQERLVPYIKARDWDKIQTISGVMDDVNSQKIQAALDMGTKDCGKP